MTEKARNEMWLRVISAIENCRDVNRLQNMLHQTLDNAEDGYRLAEQLERDYFEANVPQEE